jgi:hypothetical protein
MSEAKPYAISKQVVWEAYLKVKANHGAAGVDGQSIEAFETDLKGNLDKIWNRMSSGSYFPPPVRLVEIPKASGGSRPLGIPMRHSYCTSLQRGWGLSRERPALPWACLDQKAVRRVQERRAGLRKRAIVSGVNRIHQGPCGVD